MIQWHLVCLSVSVYVFMCMYVCLYNCQVVTCIPTRTLPRAMTLGAASNQEVEQIEKATVEEDDAAAAARRGQILWVRGLSRLQHQVINHIIRVHLSYCHSTEVRLSINWGKRLKDENGRGTMGCGSRMGLPYGLVWGVKGSDRGDEKICGPRAVYVHYLRTFARGHYSCRAYFDVVWSM